MAVKDKVTMIDNLFSDYMMGRINRIKLENDLGTVLSNITINGAKKDYKVALVENNGKEPFFAMRIFPVVKNMEELTNNIVINRISFDECYKQWKNIDDWYIEIDSGVFNRSELNFIPQEISSLLFHEVGHSVYSDKVIERFYRAFQECYVRMKFAEKESTKIMSSLYTLGLTTACTLRSWLLGKNEINEEYYADSFLGSIGYKKYLVSAIVKIIKAYGNTIDDGNEAKKDKIVEERIVWCNLNASDLIKRKNKLKDELFYQSVRSSSGFLKAQSIMILNKLGVKLRESYSGTVIECTLDVIESEDCVTAYESFYDLKQFGIIENRILYAKNNAEAALESIFKKKQKNQSLPSEYDIDAIEIEIDRITNHHDRIYVLDLIYCKLEEINEFMEFIENNEDLKRKYFAKGQAMITRLEKLRKMVLAKKDFKTDYKVFVKVPAGYEG